MTEARRLAGAAVLVTAALVVGGCGRSSGLDPNALVWYQGPQYRKDTLTSVLTLMNWVKPGQHIQLRTDAYNLGRGDLILDRIELVDAKGAAVIHDAWTLRPPYMTDWAIQRYGWVHDLGARDFAGTVVPPFADNARFGARGVSLIVDITIAGKAGDDVSHMKAMTVAGLRVSAHDAKGRTLVTVLPLGFSGCFSLNYKPPLCRQQKPSEVIKELGLEHGGHA